MIGVLGSALLVLALVAVGCEHEGPVEKAGKKVDQTVESAKDNSIPMDPSKKLAKRSTMLSTKRRTGKLASSAFAGGHPS